MSKQAFNPYMPSWEYVPDGEPHVFDGRIYVYGSHDRFNGYVYCMNDYICYSAPVEDLADWRYEGIIYRKEDEPLNTGGRMNLFAPDVTQGPDGRYYLYYVADKLSIVSVAVCDTPAGRYSFHGYVHYEDGTRLGEREGDEPQFDPGVLTEGEITYLYTGFCPAEDSTRSGATATVLGPDMLTIVEAPVIVMPSKPYSSGGAYAGHEFFEASSIRKYGDIYYFVYSSIVHHELCYATSKHPTQGFVYQGVLVSNNDTHIDTYKPAAKPMAYGGNNHGDMVQVGNDYYIFYHRHTNGTNFSRQACAERVTMLPDGRIPQAEMTSCGLNSGPLEGHGTYPAHIACHLYCGEENPYTGGAGRNGFWLDSRFPRITQEGRDGDEEPGYVTNMTDSATAGYKYFACKDVSTITLRVRGYAGGAFEVRTAWDGPVLATVPVQSSNVWTDFSANAPIPDGIQALYLTYRGQGRAELLSFSFYRAIPSLR